MRELRRQNAWIDGESLRGLDGRIIVRRILEDAPQVEMTYGDIPGGHGQRYLGRRRINRRVSIVIAIRELYDLSARARVVDAVNAWAKDGVLTVSYRPNQRLLVRRAGPAATGDVRDYNADIQIDFDAPASPFWEDAFPARLSLSGESGSGSVVVTGTAPGLAAVTVTPEAALTALTVTAGATAMAFEGLAIPAGQPVTIDHDDHGYLRIASGGASLLSKRTAASADELLGGPGPCACAFTADAACQVDFAIRGRYL